MNKGEDRNCTEGDYNCKSGWRGKTEMLAYLEQCPFLFLPCLVNILDPQMIMYAAINLACIIKKFDLGVQFN